MQNILPVIIVGAGPTGLTMALELTRYGIPVRIIDKAIKPVVHSNALAVQTRTLYAWQDMELLSHALSLGEKVNGFNLYSGNKKLASINLNLLDGDINFVLGLSQHETEKMLIERLREKNITVEMEVNIIDLQEREGNIKVVLQHKDGKQEELNTEWLIACDGGHSFVREKINIPFAGKELSQHFVLADAVVQSDLAKNEGHFFISDKGIFLFIQFDKKYSRIIVEVSNDPALKEAKSLTYAQVKELAEKLCPVKLNISEPIWTSGFWIHENIIANYRHKHIFFAGDAAHLHSPAGGQGMNTGIQDAYNFAWKLAYVLQGKAKEILLDTYQTERYPVAKNILRGTTFLTNIITTHNHLLQKLRNAIILNFSKIRFIQKKIIKTLTELEIKYSSSFLVKDCVPWQGGPKPGTFDPKLAAIKRDAGFTLMFFAAKTHQADAFAEFRNNFKYASLVKCIYINNDVSGWDGASVVDENLELHKNIGIKKPSLYLLRPDQYIGFRGELKHKSELEKYFSHFVQD